MPESCECPAEAGSGTCELQGSPGNGACPSCSERGKRIDLLTLKALLAIPLTEISYTEYFFCRSADCPTVYFSAGGEQQFGESDLRERVYQKHPADDDVFVCYCFRYSVGSVKDDQEGGPAITQAITAGIQRGLCACDIRNPQGSCCLGNVRALLNTPA